MADMRPIWLRGGHLIDPAVEYDERGDVLIADGTVRASGNPSDVAHAAQALADEGRPARVIELAEDQIVAPGFVDLHVHLREPGLEIRETVQSGARAAVQGGFTTICCMPNTQPSLDNRGVLEWIKALAQDAPARVLPIAAITKGQEGVTLTEMAELAVAGAVAFSDDGMPVQNDSIMRLALTYALNLDRPITNHCEDKALVGKGVMHAGAIATRLGLRGWPEQGETIMLARDLELTRMTNARYHAAHLSVARSVEFIRRAKDRGLRVTAEVTPHHLLLSHAWVAGQREGVLNSSPLHPQDGEGLGDGLPTRSVAGDSLRGRPSPPQQAVVGPPRRYDTSTKVNPPLRTQSDADALIQGLLNGTIDCIATDHAPHSEVDKACCFDEAAFGISGLETALGALLALVHERGFPLARLIAALTINPVRAYKLDERAGRPLGTLAPGAAGDVVIFDPQQRWTVDPAAFASQGKNTPLAGIELRGRVQMTIFNGHVVYQA